MEINVITQEEFSELSNKVEKLLSWIICNKKEAAKTMYTNKEVCEILNVSSKTLQNYRDNGMIEFSQAGRKILYTEDALQKFYESHKIKAFRN